MDTNTPSNVELPSTKKLLRSTILAIVIATIILITTVLPAEYGIDPTGAGDILGLTEMGRIKVSLSQEVTVAEIKESNEKSELVLNSESENASAKSEVKIQNGEMTISLKPNEGTELKLYMKKGDQVNYTWWTNGEVVNFDAHTDSGEYHNYSKGSKARDKGILKAFYDGRHGWWWRNRTAKVVTITLQVEGKYMDFREES